MVVAFVLAAFLVGYAVSQTAPRTPDSGALNKSDKEKDDADNNDKDGHPDHTYPHAGSSLANLNNGVCTHASNARHREEKNQVRLAMQGQGQPRHAAPPNKPQRLGGRTKRAEVGGRSQHNNGPTMDAVSPDAMIHRAAQNAAGFVAQPPPPEVNPSLPNPQLPANSWRNIFAIDPSPDPNQVVKEEPPMPLGEEHQVETHGTYKTTNPNVRKQMAQSKQAKQRAFAVELDAPALAARGNPVVANR